MSAPKQWLFNFASVGARYFLAGVFLASAIGKIVSPSQFHAFAGSLLPAVDPSALLAGVVLLEVLLIALLVYPRTVWLGGVFSFGFLLLFTLLLMYQSHSGSQISCGCFGEIIAESPMDTSVLGNVLLLCLSGFVLFSSVRSRAHA